MFWRDSYEDLGEKVVIVGYSFCRRRGGSAFLHARKEDQEKLIA